MQTRREFLHVAGASLAALLSPAATAFYRTGATPLWATAFRSVGPGGIPVATPGSTIEMGISQFADQVHPTLGPTTFWGYHPLDPLGGAQAQKHLGGIVIAHKGAPLRLTFTNRLPPTHILPVDTSIGGAAGARNRAAVHLHGGRVPWNSDGGPFAWFAPDGSHGASFANPGRAPGQATYDWPMQESARLMWFHDHALGITRLNAYAGIASALVLRDAFESNLMNRGLPEYIENAVLSAQPVRELPIVVQDKTFVGPDIRALDPSWTGRADPGSLWYAHAYDTAMFGKLGPAPAGPPPAISVVPEFFGDTMLANGTVYPQVTVEARRYRLRILNACNARFLHLQMYVDDGSPDGITLSGQGVPLNGAALNRAALNPQGRPTANFVVLGTEGGFLPRPAWVASNVAFNGTVGGGSLMLAPGERVDVLFDFAGHAGRKVVLYSDAPAPFPAGDPLNDYFPRLGNRNPVNALTPPGSGPNTREIMRFDVVPASGADVPLAIDRATDLTPGIDPLLVPLGTTEAPRGVPVRRLTLNEAFDEHGRLTQLLGTGVRASRAAGFGLAYEAPPTETPHAGAVEVWQIANLTADSHPIHFHLVNVQILSRQAFASISDTGPRLLGAPVLPPPYEAGWKETVRMNPGEVTTVVMRFDLPSVPFAVPPSPRTGGNEYVWHCHILEHEEHDMMRPLVVD